MFAFKFSAVLACFAVFLIGSSSSVSIWDRASLLCANVNGEQIIDTDSHRDLYVDPTCSSGEVVWRMTRTLVTLRFRKASPFSVCFSSKSPVGYEKFALHNFSLNNMYVGSPNAETDVCLNSVGNSLNVNLLSLGKYYIMKAYFKVRCLS
ncbi:uncharacterized protein LOC134259353 [Saccostrea cucullata]|uniref:uncharacterized protein LOC134259353 n=1 Tax=Saccostrea cuccullata TaxID=36930 RepID=UPI002ED18B7C